MPQLRFQISCSQLQGSGIYPTLLKEIAKHAEDLGYDGITHGDRALMGTRSPRRMAHELNPGHLSCLPLLAHFAAVTRKIVLTTNVLTVPLYHPAHVAVMGSTIDNVSGGRFELRAGSGGDPEEYRFFNLPFEHRGTILVEAIQVIRALWTQDDVSFQGQYFNLEHVKLASAKPIQKPAPPIWIDTRGDKEYLLNRVAKYADGWDKLYSTTKTQPLAAQVQEFKGNIQYIEQEARRLGRAPGSIRHSPGSFVMAIGKDNAATRRMADDYLLKVRGESFGSPPSGSPEHVTGYIQRWIEAGATDIKVSFVPYSIAENMAMMELFAKEVIPNFKN